MRRLSFSLALLLVLLACQAQALAQTTESEPLLLIAKPELADPNFSHSVVLVLFPQDGGPFGVILNRPTPITLKDAFPDQPLLKNRDDILYFGGPVRPEAVLFLFRRSSAPAGAVPVLKDLYLGGSSDLLDKLLTAPGDGLQRLFLGHSGWASAQLDMEIQVGAWYVLPADLDTILRMDPEIMWEELIARARAVKT